MKVWKTKLHWVKSLKVGDPVVDCKGEVSRIKEIVKFLIVPRWFYRLIRFLPLPVWEKVEMFADDHWPKKWRTWVDSDLLLENGVWCSGVNCATPPDEQ